MKYSIFFIFLMPLTFGSANEFSAQVSKFKYYCEKKQLNEMRKSAYELQNTLQSYTKDSYKGFDPSLNALTVESLYTYIKKLGTKTDVPLYRDWLLWMPYSKTKSILEMREHIFQMMHPSVKVLHKLVQVWAEDGGEADEKKKDTNVDDLLAKGSVRAATIQRQLIFCKDSKLNAVKAGGSTIWFEQSQAELFRLLSTVFQAEQQNGLSSWSFCAAAALLTKHLHAIELAGYNNAPFYNELKNLCEVYVTPVCMPKDALIPSSLLVSKIFLEAGFNRQTYKRSERLSSLIEQVNKKLFSINKVFVDGGAIDPQMERFVFQAALIRHYLSISKPLSAPGFASATQFEKQKKDLFNNLEEILRIIEKASA